MGMTPLMLAVCVHNRSYILDTPATSLMAFGFPRRQYKHRTLTRHVVKSLIDAGADLDAQNKVHSFNLEFMHDILCSKSVNR